MSLVDGFNVPFKLELDGCKTTNPPSKAGSSVIDCSTLSMADCPSEQKLGTSGRTFDSAVSSGCLSPCYTLNNKYHFGFETETAAPYCCKNEYISTTCRTGPIRETQWIK